MTIRNIALTIATLTLPVALGATPTPVPGGANQVNALSGTIGQTVWNGELNIKIVELRDAVAADNPQQINPSPGEKVMVMTALLKNGMHASFIDLLTYTLADKDDVSVEIPSHLISHINVNIQQGAAARQQALFTVDQSFVPVKLIVQCVTCGSHTAFKPVRFTVPPPSPS
jgi:hypothetical protein